MLKICPLCDKIGKIVYYAKFLKHKDVSLDFLYLRDMNLKSSHIKSYLKARRGETQLAEHNDTSTHKVQEAARHFMVSVRLGLQQLLHHGQEVSVNVQNLLDVGE